MPSGIAAFPPLVAASRLESLIEAVRTNRFSGQGSDFLQLALLAAGATLIVWFVVKIGRQVSDFLRASPLILFCQLCRAHRLTWTDWRLLWRIGRLYRLEHPAMIFLEPDRLDPSRLTSALRLHEARIASLREVLFHDPHQAEQPSASYSVADLPPELDALEQPGSPLFPIL